MKKFTYQFPFRDENFNLQRVIKLIKAKPYLWEIFKKIKMLKIDDRFKYRL